MRAARCPVSRKLGPQAQEGAGHPLATSKRPDGLSFDSELGYLPTTAYVRLAVYF